MKRRIAVRAVIIRDRKLLAVRLKSSDGTERPYWCTVGGGVHEEEDLLAAISREVIEETGVDPVVGQLLYIQQFAEREDDTEHLEFFFHVTNSEDFLDIDLSKTSHGDIEIAEIGFIDPKTENLLPKFLTNQDFGEDFSNTKIFNN